MDVNLAEKFRTDDEAILTARLIKNCVHCGFCLPVCPTYSLEQDERDSPRGRIYLVKELLEGTGNPEVARTHLDRCLTCRSCETACPSGVEYARIAHYGREYAQQYTTPKPINLFKRQAINKLLGSQFIGNLGYRLNRVLWPLLPKKIKRILPPPLKAKKLESVDINSTTDPKPVMFFNGCVQRSMMPETNKSMRSLFNVAGYRTLNLSGNCCGALGYHAGLKKQAIQDISNVLDSYKKLNQESSVPIVVAATGCASFMREYPYLHGLSRESVTIARSFAKAITDPVNLVLEQKETIAKQFAAPSCRVAIHTPCSQKNGLGTETSAVASLLEATGFKPIIPEQPPSCCGSAGIYSLLNPKPAKKLRTQMIEQLERPGVEVIVSSNIGCILHMRSATDVPIVHWSDLLLSNSDNWKWK